MITRSFTLLVTVLFAGCCLHNRENTPLLIQQEVKQLLPYADQQEVRFLTSSGDTITTFSRNITEFDDGSCAECCIPTSTEYQTVKLLQGDSVLLYIGLIAGSAQVTFDFLNIFNILSLNSANGGVVCDSTLRFPVRCLDSLLVGGVVYKTVYQMDNTDTIPGTGPQRMYYQVNKGVLRIERANGEIWEVL